MEYVDSPRKAEINAAKKMRGLGYSDAEVTGKGADGGIDVIAANAVAQVKCEAHATGRPAVQRLFGARARAHDRDMLFFVSSSYSQQAVKYADDEDVALFTYTVFGDIHPANFHARKLIARRRSMLETSSKDGLGAPQPARNPATSSNSTGKTPATRSEGFWAGLKREVAVASAEAKEEQRRYEAEMDQKVDLLVGSEKGNPPPSSMSKAERQRKRDAQRRIEIEAERATRLTVFERLELKNSQLRASVGEDPPPHEVEVTTEEPVVVPKKSRLKRFFGF